MLEIVWTAIPAVLVTAISIVSAVVLAQNGRAGSNPLDREGEGAAVRVVVHVPERQDYGYLTLPKGRHVEARHHRLRRPPFVLGPEFSQKQDAMPGQHDSIVVTPTRLGSFPVICTELCGLGHALMRSQADVVTTAEFASFMKSGASAGPPGLAGLPAERLRQLPHVQARRARPARSGPTSTS